MVKNENKFINVIVSLSEDTGDILINGKISSIHEVVILQNEMYFLNEKIEKIKDDAVSFSKKQVISDCIDKESIAINMAFKSRDVKEIKKKLISVGLIVNSISISQPTNSISTYILYDIDVSPKSVNQELFAESIENIGSILTRETALQHFMSEVVEKDN